MTPVFKAFRRWLAAEQDLNDASRLLQFYRGCGDTVNEAGARDVVAHLRFDASGLLREYFQLLAFDSKVPWHPCEYLH